MNVKQIFIGAVILIVLGIIIIYSKESNSNLNLGNNDIDQQEKERETKNSPNVIISTTPTHTPEQQAKPTIIAQKTLVPATEPTSCTAGNFDQQFLCLINDHRSKNGKTALKYDPALSTVATAHSKWMSDNKKLDHTGKDGTTFSQRCINAGTKCSAENIAFGHKEAKGLFDLWKNSAGHNKNMLGNYSSLGLGLSGIYATTLYR